MAIGMIAAPAVGGSAGAEPEPEPEASRLGDLGTAIRDGVSSVLVLPEMPVSIRGRPSPPPSMYTEI